MWLLQTKVDFTGTDLYLADLVEKGMKAGGFPTKLKTGRSMYWALEMDGEKVFLLLGSGDRRAALYLAMINIKISSIIQARTTSTTCDSKPSIILKSCGKSNDSPCLALTMFRKMFHTSAQPPRYLVTRQPCQNLLQVVSPIPFKELTPLRSLTRFLWSYVTSTSTIESEPPGYKLGRSYGSEKIWGSMITRAPCPRLCDLHSYWRRYLWSPR